MHVDPLGVVLRFDIVHKGQVLMINFVIGVGKEHGAQIKQINHSSKLALDINTTSLHGLNLFTYFVQRRPS